MRDLKYYKEALRNAVSHDNPMRDLKRCLNDDLRAADLRLAMDALADLVGELPPALMSRFYAVFGEYRQNHLDFPGAMQAYRKSLEHLEYFYSRLGLIECYAMLRKKNEVLAEMEHVTISRLPNSACAAHLILAAARVEAFDMADSIFSQAVDVYEDVYELYFAKAKCQFIRGNLVAARRIALQYINDIEDGAERKERMRREFAMDDDYVEFEYSGKHIVMIYPEFASEKHRVARSCFGELPILEHIREHHPVHGVIVDVGCHVGNHSRYFQEFLQLDYVVGFDAARNAGSYYCRNVQGAIFYNVPLGRSGEQIELYGDIINHRFGQSGVAVGNQMLRPESRPVRTWSLDEFGLQNVSLIKIDVEGWELQVLEGAMKTINEQKPLLLLEVFYDNRIRYEKFIEDSLPGYRITKRFGDMSWKKHDILVEYCGV